MNKQHNWDVHLQQLVGAIRSTLNRQTGFTPNLMMLGREVFQPADIILGLAKINSDQQDVTEYVSNLTAILNEVHDIARKNVCTE